MRSHSFALLSLALLVLPGSAVAQDGPPAPPPSPEPVGPGLGPDIGPVTPGT